MKINIFENYPKLKSELDQVKIVIDQQLTTDQVKFSEAVKNSFNENSKMIRPALALIASSYQKKDRKQAINLAAAMEILHVATLIHDDIIDNSQLRRGKPTIHTTHDVGFAVICGDYLYAKSYQLLFETQNLNALQYMGGNVVKMCFGEVEQYLERHNNEITVEKYFSIIEKKTASFFQINCVLGARLAKCSEKQVETLKQFGYYLGILFQLQDDLLDFEKSDDQLGKPSLSDVKRGNYSLPIIIAMQKDTSLKSYMNTNSTIDFDVIMKSITETNALDIVREYCGKYSLLVKKQLQLIDHAEVREKMSFLVDKIIIREF